MRKEIKKNFIVALTILMSAIPVYAGVAFDAGMAAYNAGNYNLAKSYFRSAIKSSYYDVNSRYMLSQALIKGDKNYAAARNEYQQIIKIAPQSQAAALARQGIYQLDKYFNTNSEKTVSKQTKVTANTNQSNITATEYVKNAYRGGQKYTRQRGMTRIYIENNATYKPLMQKAYKEWQSAMGSYVMFTFSGNKEDADDIVTFLKADSTTGIQEGGNCANKYDGTTITGANISIRTYSAYGEPLSKDWIYHAMLHEIGHSIGISGHSPYQGDVMAQGASVPVTSLTERDKKTARMLYQSYTKQPNSEDIKKAKEEELKDIAQRIPNDVHSYVELGDEYIAAGEYSKAAELYNKALTLQKSTDIYYRLLKAYRGLNDKDQQIIAYKNILSLNSSDKSALSGLLTIYAEQRRLKEGREILDKFIEKNPSSVKDETISNFQSFFSDRNIKKMEFEERRLKKRIR